MSCRHLFYLVPPFWAARGCSGNVLVSLIAESQVRSGEPRQQYCTCAASASLKFSSLLPYGSKYLLWVLRLGFFGRFPFRPRPSATWIYRATFGLQTGDHDLDRSYVGETVATSDCARLRKAQERLQASTCCSFLSRALGFHVEFPGKGSWLAGKR